MTNGQIIEKLPSKCGKLKPDSIFTTTSISVRIGQFLSEQSRTQLVLVISTLALSERRQILFHKIFNEGY